MSQGAPLKTEVDDLRSFRVIHSCTSESWSGLERYVVDIAKQQRDLGVNVLLYCRQGTAIERQALDFKIPVWSVPTRSRPGPWLWWQMRSLYRDTQLPTVLHMHHAGELKYHRPWLGRPGVKSVLQFHLWITHRKQDPYHKWLYDPLDQVWCSTDTARDKLAELLPVDRQRIRVINYGRDVSALLKLAQERLSLRAELDQKFALPPQSVVAICVARIERIKGINELVRAFAQVAVTRPHSHLVIVGGVSPENHDAEVYADQIKDYIGELPASLKGRIHMPGPLNQVERLIAAADIYVLPSYEECVSLALLDAMILGLPLVGTNTGGTPSVVRHGENGELVMAESIEDLAMGLERLLDDPQRRNQYGAAGATRGGEYDRDRVLAQMIKNYLHI